MKKPSKKKLLEVAVESCGVVTYAGIMCQVDRKTIQRWMAKHDWFKEAMTEGRDNFVDLGEMGLIENVKKGDVKACIYVTSTLGRKRGYTQLIETRDRSKLKDAMEDLPTEELIAMLDRNKKRIEDC
jgi:hypothetical protein